MADVTRYDPFDSPMRSLIDRLFERNMAPWAGTNGMDEGTLGVDISETPEELIVRASLPGYKRDEIDVQLHQGVLSIKAEHKESEAGGEERYHRRERFWGTVNRRLALPGVLHDANVKAELRDGVLTLRIPVPSAAKPKQIEIVAD